MQQLPQEMEFNAWGLSKIAVRNIVVFFILTLLTAIMALSRVIVTQHDQISELYKQQLIDKDRAAQKIEELKNETIKTVDRLNATIYNQVQIREEIKDTKQTLTRVQKRIK